MLLLTGELELFLQSSIFFFRGDGQRRTDQIFLCIGVALRYSEPKEPHRLGNVSLPALAGS